MDRTLVCGWFSLEGGEATAGDLLSMEVVRDLAAEHGPVDVALSSGFPDGVDWATLEPTDYRCVVFTCGPLAGEGVKRLVERFRGSRTVAVNVSVVDPAIAELFDVVVARDDAEHAEPDLSVARRPAPVPVVGVVRAHEQPEYPRSRFEQVHALLQLVVAGRPCATVDFDTRVHPGADPFEAHARSSAEVVALAARMDAVVTTRLHGMVLALAAGTPVVAVDPVEGGAKLVRQAEALGWPCVFTPETARPEALSRALNWCLTDEAAQRARTCTIGARHRVELLQDRIRAALGAG